MPARTQAPDLFEVFLAQLHESHEVSVYESIERLVHAAEVVGLSSDDLLRMLDRGTTFEELLELIQGKMELLQEAA